MNKWIGIGRLTREVEIKYSTTKPDMAIGNYTLAIDDGYGENKTTLFINCTAFGKAGEFASKYFHKGQRVAVEGRIKITKKDDKYYTSIIVENQEFADGKYENKTETKTETKADTNGFTDIDDEIPFV